MQFLMRLAPDRELWSIHNIRWLVMIRFLANMLFYSTVIVRFESSRGLNFTQMFMLESIISVAALAFDIPTGIWADQFGYRRALLLGYGLCVLSVATFAFTYGFWWFSFGSILFGTGITSISGCEDALIYESIPPEKAISLGTPAFALLNAASSAGFLFGLSAGSFMGTSDPALPVIASILPAVLAWVMMLKIRPVARRIRQEQDGPALAPAGARHFLSSAAKLVCEQPAAVGLSLFSNAAFVFINAIFWYNQPYFARVGIPVALFGPITAAAVGLQMVVALLTPLVKRRIGSSAALALSCIVPGIAYMALSITRAPLLTAMLVAFIATGHAWRQPIVNDELNRRIPDGARATTLSALSFIGTLAGIVLNPLIGRAGDLGLDITGVSIGLGLILLGLVVPFLVSRTKHVTSP
jgi:MFS family permease